MSNPKRQWNLHSRPVRWTSFPYTIERDQDGRWSLDRHDVIIFTGTLRECKAQAQDAKRREVARG